MYNLKENVFIRYDSNIEDKYTQAVSGVSKYGPEEQDKGFFLFLLFLFLQ